MFSFVGATLVANPKRQNFATKVAPTEDYSNPKIGFDHVYNTHN